MQSLDTLIFYKINSWAGSSAVLDGFFVFVTLNAYWLVWLLFLLMLLLTVDDVSLGKRIKRLIQRTSEIKKLDLNLITAVLISSGISYLTSQLIGLFVDRQRPFVELVDVVRLITEPISMKSFPSDHAAMSFALAFCVFYRNKEWGTLFLIIAALIGWSRIYVGVHYPGDVLAGLLLAWPVSWLVYRQLTK